MFILHAELKYENVTEHALLRMKLHPPETQLKEAKTNQREKKTKPEPQRLRYKSENSSSEL